MILPVRIYGDPILRTRCAPVSSPGEALDTLVASMVETMHRAHGVGLAAPQVGRRERVFVVDLTPMMPDMDEKERARLPAQPMVFVNPDLQWESEEELEIEEGCLSIPDINEVVLRPERVRLTYQSQQLQDAVLEVGGTLARVIQHEYDHLEGILFIDHISPFRRTLLKRRLREMARGMVEAEYAIAVYQPVTP